MGQHFVYLAGSSGYSEDNFLSGPFETREAAEAYAQHAWAESQSGEWQEYEEVLVLELTTRLASPQGD